MKTLTSAFAVLTILVACTLFCGGQDNLNADQPEGEPPVVVERGVDINTISKLMSKAKYEETMLQMEAADGAQLKMWTVDNGVLITTFNTTTSLATGITYYFCSNGPKANRETWSFKVERFDPRTKRMNVLLENKK